ncbi:MAG: NAD(P)-dependent alcohol dehydrogenase [Rhodospirillaceae bacterium]|nr:NAD(P)-dependent alcohol dehydrogenase [Rhodospirillaceae bacterium]
MSQLNRRSALTAAGSLTLTTLLNQAVAADKAGIQGRVPKGKMRVVQLGEQKSFDTLTMAERTIPAPGPGQALIRVHYAGIAARDQGIAMKLFPVPPGPRPATLIPLSEGCGEVLALGAGEERIKVGDRVTAPHWANWVSGPWSPANYVADVGNTIDGWLGEYILLPAMALVRVPENVASEHAATLSGSGLTAWHALHEVAHVRSDDTVLTLGTGGVSSFGLLFAKAAGARVVVTSSSDAKLDQARQLGADITVNYKTNPQWGKEVMEKTGGQGASVVLENVGPATLDQSMAAAAVNARVVMIGTGRPPPNPPNMNGMYLKNLMLKAISAGSRTMMENMITAMAQNNLKPVIALTIPFAEAKRAYTEIRDGDHFGKIVIKIS